MNGSPGHLNRGLFHFRLPEELQVIMSGPTPVVAQVAEAAEEVVGTEGLRAQRLSELMDNKELWWFPLALLLQPPWQKIQAGPVRTEQEGTEGQTATCRPVMG